jgi:serine/threonine-protein kinase
MPFRPAVSSADDVMVGPYRLEKQIGEGSIGRVYLAEHTLLSRWVALKMIRGRYAKDLRVVGRFLGEARAINQIRHENVVEVTDFLESADGKSCYVMELLEGRSLYDRLEKGAPPIRETLRLARQIASALRAVHAEGIVHRDVKPANIFLVERAGELEQVKLLDFGVAKISLASDDWLQQTRSGSVLGTPEYMAPEQTRGIDVGPAADTYAFGVLLFELLTGRRPFIGNTIAEIFDQHRNAPPPPLDPSYVPPPLAELVERCLTKDASRRPRMADVETALLNLEQPSYQRPRWIWAALAGCLGAMLAVIVTLGLHLLRPPDVVHLPALEPAPQETVIIEFTSLPSGAEVTTEGQTLGKTPLRFEVKRSEASMPFELSLPGFTPAARALVPSRDAYVMVQLAEAPKK